MAPTTIVAVSLLLVSFLAPAAGDAAAVPMSVEEVEALAADDECDATAPEGHCALSAAQLRAQVRKHEAVTAQPEEDEPPTEGSEDSDGVEGSSEGASLLGAPTFSSECFAYTGGTCTTSTCDAWRNAQCSQAKCVCTGCAGADGKCYEEKNKLVAKRFYLTNGKYDKYKMYFQRASAFGQMTTTKMWSTYNMDQDLFDLYEVPGTMADGKKAYFLSSSKWPQSVVGFKATTGTAVSPFATYAVDLAQKVSVLDTWGPSSVMLNLCSLGPQSSYPGAVQIGAQMAGKTVWAYIHHGSYLVYGSLTSPGEGGYWIPDPPLPADLQLPLCA